MALYSVAEANADLDALVAAAERGEEVVITRDGAPVVRLTPEEPAPGATRSVVPGRLDPEWFEKHRVQLSRPLPFTWAELIREERDAGY